ncbi:hypothetical protein FRB99_001356 [Tulasnella sp. 403]|nr:hypothetical protein FRB99_001356 [Tulasnella sp. 403]
MSPIDLRLTPRSSNLPKSTLNVVAILVPFMVLVVAAAALAVYIRRRRQGKILPPPVVATRSMTSQLSAKSVSMVPRQDIMVLPVDASLPTRLSVDVGTAPSLCYELSHLVQSPMEPPRVAVSSFSFSTQLPYTNAKGHSDSIAWIESSFPSPTVGSCSLTTSQSRSLDPKSKGRPRIQDFPPLSAIVSNDTLTVHGSATESTLLSTSDSPPTSRGDNAPNTPGFLRQSLCEPLDSSLLASDPAHDRCERVDEEETGILWHPKSGQDGDVRYVPTDANIDGVSPSPSIADDGYDTFGLSGSDSDGASTASDCETEESVTTVAPESPQGDNTSTLSPPTSSEVDIVQCESSPHCISLVPTTYQPSSISAPIDLPTLDTTSTGLLHPRAECNAAQPSTPPVLPDSTCAWSLGAKAHKLEDLEKDGFVIASDSESEYSQGDSDYDSDADRDPFIYDQEYVPRPLGGKSQNPMHEGSSSAHYPPFSILPPVKGSADADAAKSSSDSEYSQDDDGDYDSEADRDPFAYDKGYVPAPWRKRPRTPVSSLHLLQPTMPLNIGSTSSRPRSPFLSLSDSVTSEISRPGSSGSLPSNASLPRRSVLHSSLQELHDELDAAVAELTRSGCEPINLSG